MGGIKLTPAEIAVYNESVNRGEDGYRAVAFQRLAAKWQRDPAGFITWKAGAAWDLVRAPWSAVPDPSHPIAQDLPKLVSPGFRFMEPSPYAAWKTTIGIIHTVVLLLAVAALLLLRRRPVVWLIASLPIYTLVVHTIVISWNRYFYPAMPAVVLLASLTVAYGLALYEPSQGLPRSTT